MTRPICGVTSLALFACTLLACKKEDDAERKPLPDWSDGYEQSSPISEGGVSVEDAGLERPDAPEDAFAVLVASDVEYPARLLKAGTNDACAVPRGAPNEPIDCILDHDELDLNVLGFALDVVAPKGMCDFFEYSGYLFENWEVGTGPTEVSFTVHEDGTFSDEVNSENGVPQCAFNYEAKYGKPFPNCCLGSYVVTIKSEMSGLENEVPGLWGNNIARCYEGGAFYFERAVLSADGFPLDEVIYVGGEAHTERYKFNGISAQHITNLPLANYWDPEDLDGEMPAPLRGVASRPDYVFTCEDAAAEWRAVVRVHVREWNEEVEFDAERDPDTIGLESGWGTPINDLVDWGDAAADSVTFPELYPVR